MKEIFVRLDRCTGCHTCEIACATQHSASQDLFGASTELPRPRKRLYVEQADDRPVPVLCRHCEDASCVRACRTAALTQDTLTRIVSHDRTKCIGCWMCTMVCPYGVLGRAVEERVAVKCDRCPGLDTPACVTACPTRALVFTEEELFAGQRRRRAAAELAQAYSTARVT